MKLDLLIMAVILLLNLVAAIYGGSWFNWFVVGLLTDIFVQDFIEYWLPRQDDNN